MARGSPAIGLGALRWHDSCKLEKSSRPNHEEEPMAPHDLIFIVGVLVFGLLEVAASIVTSWNDRPSSVASWAEPASDGAEGSAIRR